MRGSRMRIAYVLNTLAVGGTEKQVLAIAGRMAARGHAVALVVLKAEEPDGCATDLDVVHLEMGKDLLGVISGLRCGLRFLRAFRPDVIHSHNFHGNMMARIMRLFYPQAKLIATIHNVYEGGRLRMLAYRMTDRLVDRTTAVSSAVAERYVRLKAVAKSKCLVLTNGIDIDEFHPDAVRRTGMRANMGVADEFVWLTVGRLTAAKDLGTLLQAFGTVCRTRPHAHLWIAGEPPARERGQFDLFGVAQPAEVRDRVRLLGLRRDVPALLDAADGFVLSSAWEGMPLALGEAMAMEKPVVATDVGGVRELVGEAGVLVPAGDPAALGKAMLQCMERSPEDRVALGRAARGRIATYFAINSKADAWDDLYRVGHLVIP
jgi:glycosyltransferase involved in cell wall biosynthesis